ncbi:phosphate uptake regulator PhoU [Sulfurimonas sp. MAG313]|nr:PhoU domain-containing protein [Sulfurimonas sp. MAG313]MDF1881460.1 phosphate uptake regulator PhoU [Sulfurimonas sp. MAG313]
MLPSYRSQIITIREKLAKLVSEVVDAHNSILEAYKTKNISMFDEVKGILKSIQTEANVIDNEIILTLSLFDIEEHELRLLITYLKITNELIRIGEGAKKYARRMKAHCDSDCNLDSFSDVIIKLHSSSISALKFIEGCFSDYDEYDYENLYRCVMVEESKCNDLYSILEKDIHSRIIIEGELSIEYVRVLSTLRKLERASEYAINITKLMIHSQEDGEIKSY